MRRRHAEAFGDFGRGWQVHWLLAAGGLGRPHVAVVDVGLQVALGQVGALASRHNTAHVEGTPLALLDALHWVCAVVHGEAWAHLLSFLLVKQSTVVAENMFAGDHPSIELDRKTTFITKVDWYFIPLSNQIQLIVPKQWLRESPLTCKHITSFGSTIKPLLLLEAKVIFSWPAAGSLCAGQRFAP